MRGVVSINITKRVKEATEISLMDKLYAAKDQAALQEFKVRITETLQKTVKIEAYSRDEAKEIAEAKWKDSEYILDADHFTGTTFEVLYGEQIKVPDTAR